MKVITVAGTPSSGKTSVIIHVARYFSEHGEKVAMVKFDALDTMDDVIVHERLGIPTLKGISDYICPDHYYVSNLEEVFLWGEENNSDILIIETAGLCLRCAPHIKEVPAITVVDNLSGLDAPQKMGPSIFHTDVIVITKADLVSQAEREVFKRRIQEVNPVAKVVNVNGLTGKGTLLLKRFIETRGDVESMTERELRYSLPASLCSYCTGEVRIGKKYQSGSVVKIV
jgi:Ni2+-binding GTPase involved in maturation of urease and hydrogenase